MGMDCRKWTSLGAVLNQYVLFPMLEAECWDRGTPLITSRVFPMLYNIQKVWKFIVSKGNKLGYQDRASTIYTAVHRCVTSQKDMSL